jgi:hypothetical protein
MTPSDITRRTLGELISDPDPVIQRHAHGIVKRLRAGYPQAQQIRDITPPRGNGCKYGYAVCLKGPRGDCMDRPLSEYGK